MVTEKTLMIDIEKHFPQSDAIFMEFGMGHLGTLMAYFNTVGESALANGIDPDVLVMAINKVLESDRYAV